MILVFTVDKQIITRRDNEKVVRDSVNYLHVNFSFSEEWTGDKTAVFKSKSGIAYNVLVGSDGSCLVPWEVLKEEYFEVSAFCGDLITANVVKVFTIPSGYEIGSQGRIPTPDIYTQIIARLSAIEAEIDPTAIQQVVDEYLSDKDYVTEQDVEQIVSDYVEAHKDELKGDTGATGPQGPQGAQGPKGDTGEGIAAGGTTGQVLIKSSDADYETEWSSGIATKAEVAESADATAGTINDSLITSYIAFDKPFEFGFINNNTGIDSDSTHWARTGFFDYATTVLHLDKRDTVSAAWNVFLYDYDANKQYIGRTQLAQEQTDRHLTANITAGHYYRLLVTINYTTDDPMSVYSHWKITLETAFSNLEMAKSSTVSKVETMTPSEFNSRPSDDNAMTNNVQYNIYENNYMFLHNGKYGGYLSDRNYLSKFAIISDAHVGRSGYSSADEAKYISAVENINSLGVDFAIEMGDNIDDGYSYTDKTKFDTEIANHNTVYSHLNTPLFSFGGNHDTAVAKFSQYGTVDFNKVRIIKIHADYSSLTPPEGQTYWSTGIVPESQLTYLENQLSNSKADVNIVVCHYPIAIDDTYQTFKWWIRDEFTDANGNTKDGHRDDLIAILNDYNVKVFLNGHEHSQIWDNWGDVGNIKDYNSPNFNKGYTIATVNATSIVFDYYDTATNTLQGTRTISL